jgi:hypothetical protein
MTCPTQYAHQENAKFRVKTLPLDTLDLVIQNGDTRQLTTYVNPHTVIF